MKNKYKFNKIYDRAEKLINKLRKKGGFEDEIEEAEYSLYEDKDITYEELKTILKIMEELWFYLLPTDYGLNSVKLFYDGIKNYYSNKEVTIDYINVDIKDKPSLDEIINFISKELSEDRPIAFLNLCNGEENNLDRWHWVLVVEIFEENGEYFFNIIDDKKIKKINLSLWYRTITNDGGFITFK